jgi:ribosome-binding ATPase YchF (GTP1/OBG family)
MEFRDGLSALEAVLREIFAAADLITFFTANEKEARAWTLRNGGSALDAAGAVHSDLARGLVRCEVIRWSDLVESRSRAEAAHRGLQRIEGKTYVVQDGDVLNVRSSV